MDDLAHASATELLRQLSAGLVTAEELVRRLFERRARLDGRLNALVQIDHDGALREAARIDSARAHGEPMGALAGLPLSIKEAFHVRGLRTTAGAVHLKENVAAEDAPAVSRLRAQGAIVLAKTNVPTFTADWQTFNDVYGTTNNPWDEARTPGGSSGGAAAALAARLVPAELGSDLCGCIRVPAHYCGVFGHRSTYGLVSVRGHVPGDPASRVEPDLASAGPMARSAADLRLLLRVLADPWIEPTRALDLSGETLGRGPALRVLCWLDTPGHAVDVDLLHRYHEVLDRLAAHPWIRLEHGEPEEFSSAELLELCMALTGRLMATAMSPIQRLGAAVFSLGGRWAERLLDLPDGVLRFHRAMLESAAMHDAVDRRRRDCAERVARFFERYDLLITPVSPCAAFPHDHGPLARRRLHVNGALVHYNEHLAWNALATVVGLPATVVPVGRTAHGLPCGLQVIGPRFADDRTLDLAELLEDLIAWREVPDGYA